MAARASENAMIPRAGARALSMFPMIKRALLATVLMGAAGAASACSAGPEVKGTTGFGVTEGGDIVVRVQPCGAGIDYVSVSDRREGYQQNPGAFKARTPQSDPFVFNLSEPAEWWDPKDPFTVSKDTTAPMRALAASTAQNTETLPVAATVGEILALKPDEILIGDSVGQEGDAGPGTQVVTKQEFERCPFPEQAPNAPR